MKVLTTQSMMICMSEFMRIRVLLKDWTCSRITFCFAFCDTFSSIQVVVIFVCLAISALTPSNCFFLLHHLYTSNDLLQLCSFFHQIQVLHSCTLTLLPFRKIRRKVIATVISHIISADGNDAVKVEMFQQNKVCSIFICHS